MTKRPGRLAIGGLVLAGLGYLAGVLTAPKSGRETRKEIKKTASRAKSETEKKLKDIHNELGNLLDSGKQTATNVTTKAKTGLEDAISKGQAARDRVRHILSAFHEGETDDKDLKKALKDAEKAIDHLKKYVGKNVGPKKA